MNKTSDWGEMVKAQGDIWLRLIVFIIGLLVMSFGIDLFIVSNLGATPWDTLHVGLYEHFGLTIGSWSIIVGFFCFRNFCTFFEGMAQIWRLFKYDFMRCLY